MGSTDHCRSIQWVQQISHDIVITKTALTLKFVVKRAYANEGSGRMYLNHVTSVFQMEAKQ